MRVSLIFALHTFSALALASGVAHPRSDLVRTVSTQADRALFWYKGHDLSSLVLSEKANTTYCDTAKRNQTRPAEDILGDGGMNTVRLRLWVNPTPGQYDLDYTLRLAQRMHAKGYRIYLDMFFSDNWADPTKQVTPAAWPQDDLNALTQTLRNYVKSTLTSFHAGGVDIDILALGNEIRKGMLWPLGEVNPLLEPESARITNFTNLATLWAAARAGVDDAVKTGVRRPQSLIHIDSGWDKTLQQNWFDAFFGTGKVKLDQVDALGFSNYPFYGTGATTDALLASLNAIVTKWPKPIHVVETDWPVACTGTALSENFPISAQGQSEWVAALVKVMKQVDGGYGAGVHYWEPTWLSNENLGSSCSDNLLFAGDWSGWPNKVVGYSRSSVNMFRN
ncbi:glycoside hydrolase family 53 protein [Myriangium duriaei CBS 260.36]|uniref:Arabinogalactan endo-beta-1,4-galactanase n=1 Tax=Myriangium duriaei CBS 260.36 TaxID=1168546 RepID=A0A9P4J078_9PEZI|nr:glycoside hydrolase family 53 protein [Myriangium duriaei CBS 260.36]